METLALTRLKFPMEWSVLPAAGSEDDATLGGSRPWLSSLEKPPVHIPDGAELS